MQINAETGDKYDERASKDSRFEYSIHYNADAKQWTVYCWRKIDNSDADEVDCHWAINYHDHMMYDPPVEKEDRTRVNAETRALMEFNRFD